MEVDSETLGKLTQWAEQSGRKLQDLVSLYEKHFSNIKETRPGLDDIKIKSRARFMVYREIKSRRYTRAKPVDAIFFGFNQEFDLTRADRRYAQEMYRTSRQEAIDKGLTKEDGTVLDTQEVMPWGARNPNVGEPLLPRYIRQSVGIGRPSDGEDLKLLVLTHVGDQALKKPPLGKAVRFLANLRADEEFRRLYNTSTMTQYEPTEMEEFGKVDDGTVCDILADSPEEFKSDLSGLESWHYDHQADRRRVVIIESDVIHVGRTPMSTGNYLMVIEDESTMDFESEGVTVFIHPQIAHQLEFGPGSRVFIVARSGMGPFYDRETRTVNPDIQRPILNALGIWAVPEYRLPLEASEAIQGES